MNTSIQTFDAPEPIGPFSQAIVTGNHIYVAAQFGRDPYTGTMMTENIEVETARVMENIKAILTAAGASFNQVVKASIFLKDMRHYAAVNAIYGSYFLQPFPARETIQVAGLPMDVNIEISVIAVRE
jgi:2-iminobutanoate/2-iminopropanoate deaminase